MRTCPAVLHGVTVLARSLTWVAAWRGDRLIGYVNVAADGGTHPFVLDTTVHPDEHKRANARSAPETSPPPARSSES